MASCLPGNRLNRDAYLAVSAVSGYALGASRLSPVRSLWLAGYLPSAVGSGLIGVSELLHLHAVAFYLAVGVLGFGMGGVETYEPTLVFASASLRRGRNTVPP